MTALAIFAFTYVAFGIGRVPGLRSDRMGAAVIGAALMIALRVLTFDEAERAVDGPTLALLFGMMVLAAGLDVSGAFALAGWWVMRRAGKPLTLLIAVSVVSAVLSAIMINDVVCLAFTPLLLHICDALECNPKPYLIALATSSNIGSVATITGNPQNILIASLSHISYGRFAYVLAPVAVVSLAINIVVLCIVFRHEIREPFSRVSANPPPEVQRRGVWKGALVSVAVLVAFMVGASPPIAALLGGSVMLLTRATKPERLYARVDWPLLALFTGLFVVVAGIERAGVAEHLMHMFAALRTDTVWGLSILTAILSNLVSNVPAVMVLKSTVPTLPHPESAWLTLAMASTLAGNLTLPGSLATIIVAERAKDRSPISFLDFLKVGLPSGILGILFGAAWLKLVAG